MRGVPVKFSSPYSRSIYLYAKSEDLGFAYAKKSSMPVGRSFYLCKYDISSEKYLIANTFSDCEFGDTLGWS